MTPPKHPLYQAWVSMRGRCGNPNHEWFERYGGRGISVCEEWQSYDAFYEWALAAGWSKGLLLDRVDNDGDYEPTNCRWTDIVTSNRNRGCVNKYLYCGAEYTVGELYELLSPPMSYQTLKSRLLDGWPVDSAVKEFVSKGSTPKYQKYEYKGRLWSSRELFDEFRPTVSFHTFSKRLTGHGWSVEEALVTPTNGRRKNAH